MSIFFRSELAARNPTFQFSLTLNRKLLTVQARNLEADKADAVADMLCHRRTTADQYYDVSDQR
ncbi:hypothetical protein DPMN_075461 [Dreissena polymorpha]|uniref:Uncharacterized protein n=1 Tax=Dreissena polymorpha TaxID=45954 RepID=A0A9D3YH86_DREPO|nr:hypothetical protein DPMN_075461 [Dreissena polymorpha]